MIRKLEAWSAWAEQFANELRDGTPQQYETLKENLTVRRGFSIKQREERLSGLYQNDPVAFQWLKVMEAASELEFELFRLCMEVTSRAERNGVKLGDSLSARVRIGSDGPTARTPDAES